MNKILPRIKPIVPDMITLSLIEFSKFQLSKGIFHSYGSRTINDIFHVGWEGGSWIGQFSTRKKSTWSTDTLYQILSTLNPPAPTYHIHTIYALISPCHGTLLTNGRSQPVYILKISQTGAELINILQTENRRAIYQGSPPLVR